MILSWASRCLDWLRSRLGVEEEPAVTGFELNYDHWIHLDAEALAEGHLGEAYELLLPELRNYVAHPAKIDEEIDNDALRYIVHCGPKQFVIFAPELGDSGYESWGRATYGFFTIVNDQLSGADHRLFAINAGNDLGGMFLTQAEAEAARKSLPRRLDWPYIPTDEPPWYGQYQ